MHTPRPCKPSLLAVSCLLLFGTSFGSKLSADSTAPLQPRDLDGNPATIEAYYYSPGNLTWLADANIGLSETFGLQRAEFFSEFGSEINQQGRMLREGLVAFMAGMNTSEYLGYSGWRLPAAAADDPGCAVTTDPDFVWATGANCSGPEVGQFNMYLNALYGSIDNSPFVNLQSDNGEPEPFGHWLSSSGPAGRNFFSFGGAGDLKFCGSGRCGGRYVWPVHDGDIGVEPSINPNQCNDTDGDGWGWNGVTSCRTTTVTSECVDSPPVGDGWGWNGVTSCRIETTATTNCVDTSPTGDGWGWNGTTSCRVETTETNCEDTPPVGDGWGWDGSTSCRIEATVRECRDSPPIGNGWGWNGVASCRV